MALKMKTTVLRMKSQIIIFNLHDNQVKFLFGFISLWYYYTC